MNEEKLDEVIKSIGDRLSIAVTELEDTKKELDKIIGSEWRYVDFYPDRYLNYGISKDEYFEIILLYERYSAIHRKNLMLSDILDEVVELQ